MADAVDVGRLEDLPESVITPTQAGGRELALVRKGDAVYALRNICPHMTTSFEGGKVGNEATGSVGAPDFPDDRPVITCPWHRYEFSLLTGQCLTHEALRVRTYPVTLADGRILVDLEGRGRAA